MASRWNSIILLFCLPELLLSAVVTLHTLEIYTTHEWVSTPTIYFQCNGENKTVLPDVKDKNTVYTFRGEESFQPLTDFKSTKCKRCGFYEKDRITSDDVFDEWEFCPSDFKSDDGRYIRTKAKELNATFLCPECVKKGMPKSSDNVTPTHEKDDGMHWSIKLIIGITVVASTILLIMGLIVAYKHWLKRKRQQEQARFLKLFEDTDDREDELGIGPLSDSI
ncbi:hypothetical protein L1987_84288 [Smallanthus sonchifolius]|uniref:Uncharacterized protein n=1 Tax=Smallanthus sonchifolius TaxID=185202 RepID=A0ACB8YF81_9ASTR|nr:hypothetical protein L1987_84288 [Smallanthus sonchifolius]